MKTDTVFLTIINQKFDAISNNLPSKDVKTLYSLAKSIIGPNFITENQGRLLIRIVQKHIEQFKLIEPDISTYIDHPLWSKPFRVINTTKKVYISSDEIPRLVIEISFSISLKAFILNLKIKGLSQSTSGKEFILDLTERNIVTLVTKLTPLGFEFDQKILDYYEIISSWSKECIRNKFLINTIDSEKYQQSISEDIGINTPLNQDLIIDRSVRYQYYTPRSDLNNSLTSIIANRTHFQIWIDNSIHSLQDLIRSLIELKRLPLLVVFDESSSKKYLEDLKNLTEALKHNNINDSIGIYFRLKNENGKNEFNQMVSDLGLNCQLDNTTKVVGVQNGKIPKFLLKTDWQPLSIISINHSLRNNKTAIYANRCDLIISYSSQRPLLERIWEQN